MHEIHKIFFTTLVFLMITSCSEDDNGPQKGCVTAVINGTNTRTYIACKTRDEYADMDFKGFTNPQWEPVSDCSECN